MGKILFRESCWNPEALDARQPRIAVMASVENGKHDLGDSYMEALKRAGVTDVIIYDWYKVKEHLEMIKPGAILLPSGASTSPESFYGDERKPKSNPHVVNLGCERHQAYQQSIEYAKAHNLPIMGINGAAQIMAAYCGAKLLRKVCEKDSHKVPGELWVHDLKIMENTWLRKALNRPKLTVNSGHIEGIDPENVGGCQIMAVSCDEIDGKVGVIEALMCPGISDLAIALQFNPEDIAAIDSNCAEAISCRDIFRAFARTAFPEI